MSGHLTGYLLLRVMKNIYCVILISLVLLAALDFRNTKLSSEDALKLQVRVLRSCYRGFCVGCAL